jgi:anti-anti-sigma factor
VAAKIERGDGGDTNGRAASIVLSDFAVQTDEHGRSFHVSVSGELDIAATDELDAHLKEVERREPSLIVLDLRELSFIDSSGLRSILTAHARARDGQWRLVLVEGPEAVQRVFHITGLNRQLTIVGDPGDLGDGLPAESRDAV